MEKLKDVYIVTIHLAHLYLFSRILIEGELNVCTIKF